MILCLIVRNIPAMEIMTPALRRIILIAPKSIWTVLHHGWRNLKTIGVGRSWCFLKKWEMRWTWCWTTSSTTKWMLRPRSPVPVRADRQCKAQSDRLEILLSKYSDTRWTMSGSTRGRTGTGFTSSSIRLWRWPSPNFKLDWRLSLRDLEEL